MPVIPTATWTAVAFALMLTGRPSLAVSQRGAAGDPPRTTPEAVGLRSAELARALRTIKDQNIDVHSIVIVRGGRLALETHFYPNAPGIVHDLASVTKSVTSMLIGIMIDRGLLPDVEAPVLSLFPDKTGPSPGDNRQSVTIEDLLTMRSGWCRDFAHGEAQLDAMRHTNNWVEFMLHQPMVGVPGRTFAYCTGTSHLLSAVISRLSGMSAEAFAREFLFGPLGITDVIWPADPQGVSTGGFDLHMHPVDAAKLGLLMLRDGQWAGRQVLSSGWVRQSSTIHVRLDDGDGYGYRWWMPDETPGLYEGRGRGGQRLAVWPEQDLVVVLTGSGFDPGPVGQLLLRAMAPLGPLPPDSVGVAALAEAVAAAAAAPSPRRVPLPDLARRISSVRFVFDANPLDLDTLMLTFEGQDLARLLLTETDGTREVTAVGLDGVYRTTNASRFGLPEAVMGTWVTGTEFHLRYNEFADNHLWDIRLRFAGDGVQVGIVERSGLLDTVVAAHRVPHRGGAR